MKLVDKFNSKSIKVENLLLWLLILGIVLIPFDNLPYLSNILGELSFKASVYPFILIIIILFILTLKNKEIYFEKSKEVYILIIFLLWTFISIIVNFSSILENNFKDRSGLSKVILQLMVLGFMILVFYCTSIITKVKKITLYDLRKYILISLIPVIIYGTIELIHLIGIVDFSWIIEKISYLIQSYHRGVVYTKGIRSVTGEVSYFAMYIAFALPWLASYIFTENNKKRKVLYSLITGYVLILLIFSKSRTAYAIIFIQLFMFALFMLSSKIESKSKILLIKIISISIIMFFILNATVLSRVGGDSNSINKLSIKSLITSLKDPNNMSNVARLGMQNAAVKIGLDNPIVGVGMGQYGFYTSNNLSEKALTSDEVKRWIDPEKKDIWPSAFAIYPRILAEQGIVGVVIWIVFLGYILIKAILTLKRKTNDIIGIALIVSFIGIAICWWNADSFGQIQFWIILPFVIRYNNKAMEETKILSEGSAINEH